MLFETLLIPDIRYIVYDYLLSQPHTIEIDQHKDQSPEAFPNLIEAFPSLREEFQHWRSQQKSHPEFGLLDPHTAVFSCHNSKDVTSHLQHLAPEIDNGNGEMTHNLRVVGTPGVKWKHLLGELSVVAEKLENLNRLEVIFPQQAHPAHVWRCVGCQCLSCSFMGADESIGVYLPRSFINIGGWRVDEDSRALVCTVVGEGIPDVLEKLGFVLD